MPLKDRVALVTGRGIGRAIALALAPTDASIAINYRSGEAEGRHVLAEIGRSRPLAIRADVYNAEDLREMFSRIKETLGPVDILVNNAGITRDQTLVEMSPAQWHEVINVDLNGVFNCCFHAIPDMIVGRWGRIVNISSVVSEVGAFDQTNYSSSKAGVIGLSRSLALELARFGVTVNVVCPGISRPG